MAGEGIRIDGESDALPLAGCTKTCDTLWAAGMWVAAPNVPRMLSGWRHTLLSAGEKTRAPAVEGAPIRLLGG